MNLIGFDFGAAFFELALFEPDLFALFLAIPVLCPNWYLNVCTGNNLNINSEGGRMRRYRLDEQMIWWNALGTSPSQIRDEHAEFMKTDARYREEFLSSTSVANISEEFAGHIRTLYNEKGWSLPEHDDLVAILEQARETQIVTHRRGRLSGIAGDYVEVEPEIRLSHEYRMEHTPYWYVIGAVQDCQKYSPNFPEKQRDVIDSSNGIELLIYAQMLQAYIDSPKVREEISRTEIVLSGIGAVIDTAIQVLTPWKTMYELFLLQSKDEIEEAYGTLHKTGDDVVDKYKTRPPLSFDVD